MLSMLVLLLPHCLQRALLLGSEQVSSSSWHLLHLAQKWLEVSAPPFAAPQASSVCLHRDSGVFLGHCSKPKQKLSSPQKHVGKHKRFRDC